jgi:hypothetical protein
MMNSDTTMPANLTQQALHTEESRSGKLRRALALIAAALLLIALYTLFRP